MPKLEQLRELVAGLSIAELDAINYEFEEYTMQELVDAQAYWFAIDMLQ